VPFLATKWASILADPFRSSLALSWLVPRALLLCSLSIWQLWWRPFSILLGPSKYLHHFGKVGVAVFVHAKVANGIVFVWQKLFQIGINCCLVHLHFNHFDFHLAGAHASCANRFENFAVGEILGQAARLFAVGVPFTGQEKVIFL
jgi:hypothetical protein